MLWGSHTPGDGIHIFLNTASPGGKRCSERAEPLGPAGASAKNTTHSRLPSFQLHSVCRVFDRRLNYTLSFPHDQTPRPFLLIIIFKRDYKKRTFRWITLNPETTWRAELKIKEEASRGGEEGEITVPCRWEQRHWSCGGDMVSVTLSRPGRKRSGQQ